MFIFNFFLGLFVIAIGVLMLKYNFKFGGLVGRNNVFERRLGSGSTYLMLKILALLIILWGLLLALSLNDNLLDWLLTPIANFFESKSS